MYICIRQDVGGAGAVPVLRGADAALPRVRRRGPRPPAHRHAPRPVRQLRQDRATLQHQHPKEIEGPRNPIIDGQT